MSKYHILGAFLTLAAWSGSYSPTIKHAGGFQVGSLQVGRVAQAERWTPNPDRGSASSTLSGGRRGESTCASEADSQSPSSAITLLVPDGTVGLTTEAQPTMSWLLESDRPANMEFMLSHPDQATPVYTQRITANAGLVEVSLPETAALDTDTRYRWTVFLSCHDGEREVYSRSFIERVSDSSFAFDTTDMTLLEQASIYAESGIWYDALNSLVKAYRADANTHTLDTLHQLLVHTNAEVPIELSLAR